MLRLRLHEGVGGKAGGVGQFVPRSIAAGCCTVKARGFDLYRREDGGLQLRPHVKIAVLNPKGNDPDQEFPDGAGAPNDAVHGPVNYHGFAACTGGGFYRRDQSIPADVNHVVLLLRHDLKSARQAMVELRALKKTVALAWKEAGNAVQPGIVH